MIITAHFIHLVSRNKQQLLLLLFLDLDRVTDNTVTGDDQVRARTDAKVRQHWS